MTAPYLSIFTSSPVLLNSDVSICTCVRTSTKSFFDFDLIWYMGRLRPDMHTNVTSTRSKVKVKVTELLKFQKLYFSRSIYSTILAWSSKLMVVHDRMGPSLQLIGARFFNFLPRNLSPDFRLRGMSIFHEFQGPYFRTA